MSIVGKRFAYRECVRPVEVTWEAADKVFGIMSEIS